MEYLTNISFTLYLVQSHYHLELYIHIVYIILAKANIKQIKV